MAKFIEDENTELKEIVVEDIKKVIIGFANTNGGILYIGVKDNGKIVGVNNPDEVMQKIGNMVRDSINPDITMFLHYKVIDSNNKKIVSVQIQKGTNKPYYLSKHGLKPSGVFVRQGTSTVSASDSAIRKMIKESDKETFEENISTIQELTFKSARNEFLERKISFGKQQMATLGMLRKDGWFTNLALLISDQCIQTIKIAVFEGINQEQFQDRQEFSGSLLKQLNDAYDFIERHNQKKANFNGLRRIDTKNYPDVAIREALLNSVVHRDYSFKSSSLVSIYSDRIEIVSIGGLMPGISQDDIMIGYSVCRNRNLANIFYRLELIEAYGTGIRKIMNSYADCERKPLIEITSNIFKITLPNINYISNKSEEKSNIYKLNDFQDNYSKRETSVLEFINTKRRIKRKELEEYLSLSQATVCRILKKLIDENKIVKSGLGKNSWYEISNKK